MFRSCSRGDLRTGSAALSSWPSILSQGLMRLFARIVACRPDKDEDASVEPGVLSDEYPPPAPPISPFSDVVVQRWPHSAAPTGSRTTRGAQRMIREPASCRPMHRQSEAV